MPLILAEPYISPPWNYWVQPHLLAWKRLHVDRSLFSLLLSPGITMGIWAMTMGGLVYAHWSRWIEKFDLLIIAGVTGGECNFFAVFA